jgi:alpha,alpha-trehalase
MNRYLYILVMITNFLGCSTRTTIAPPTDLYSTELFREVQLQAVFPDSKTFVDCIPKRDLEDILANYDEAKTKPGFNLREFVLANFTLPDRPQTNFTSNTSMTMEAHIEALWPVLTRQADQYDPNSSLLPLPNPYIVPGGRFSEIYYWDSYFTMLGLRAQGRFDMIANMVSNFAFLIDSVGFIPNGNRNYYLSRSQPPFFSLMVSLLHEYDDEAMQVYLRAMQREYAFWMNGHEQLKNPGDAFEHVVMMTDGTVLNRYFDKRPEPRPEAFKEDVHTAHEATASAEFGKAAQQVFSGLRAAAESGWDFSSRWFADGRTRATIQTTDIVPVDLNCLLYHLETMIEQGLKLSGKDAEAQVMRQKADARRKAILTFFWDPEKRFFFDFNVKKGSRTPVKSLAGVYPLFFLLAQPDMASDVSKTLQREFLKSGGLITTLEETGEQWDAPNGWAPLQWIAYQGLKNYKIHDVAMVIKSRWLRQNLRVFQATGKMMEKYNVMDTTLVAGGGEYPNQDGFGWTNGVALALLKDRIE